MEAESNSITEFLRFLFSVREFSLILSLAEEQHSFTHVIMVININLMETHYVSSSNINLLSLSGIQEPPTTLGLSGGQVQTPSEHVDPPSQTSPSEQESPGGTEIKIFRNDYFSKKDLSQDEYRIQNEIQSYLQDIYNIHLDTRLQRHTDLRTNNEFLKSLQ